MKQPTTLFNSDILSELAIQDVEEAAATEQNTPWDLMSDLVAPGVAEEINFADISELITDELPAGQVELKHSGTSEAAPGRREKAAVAIGLAVGAVAVFGALYLADGKAESHPPVTNPGTPSLPIATGDMEVHDLSGNILQFNGGEPLPDPIPKFQLPSDG